MRTNVKKFRLALTTLTLVALMLSVFGAVPAWAATLDVDNTDPSCNDTTGTPYCTIQAAIDAASNGDTINVAAGTYAGFTVATANIEVRGAQYNNDPAGATTRGGAGDVDESVINSTIMITADNVTVNGFKTGYPINVGYDHAHYVNISYNISENADGHWGAIHLHGTAAGPVYNQCDWGYIGYNTISGTTSPDWQGGGIWTVGNDDVTIEYNHILNSQYMGIYAPNHVGDRNIIRYNTITNSGHTPIRFWGGSDADISYNVVDGGGSDGIWVDQAVDNSTVSYNQISNVTYAAVALRAGATGVNVHHNTITASGTGVEKHDNDITGITVNYNDIYGNSAGFGGGCTAALDVRYNYWGGGGIGAPGEDGNNSCNATADYSPWLGAPVGTSPMTWGTDDSVQDAIDVASAGDTINVAAGTYNEGITIIDKDLTIVGATTPSKPVVKPTADTGTANSIGASGRGWFQIHAGATVDFENLVFDGTGKLIHTAVHYHADSGGGTVESCDFVNIAHTPSGYQGRGINNYGLHVEVLNCTFTNIYRIGVFTYNPTADTLIKGCTYTGKGAGDWLDYAFEVGSGGNASIEENTITNCTGVALIDGSTSAGILVTTYFGPGTQATITDNTLTDNTVGIAVGYGDTDTSVVVAHYNNISGNTDYGIDSTGPAVDAENNWWGSAYGPQDDTGSTECLAPFEGGWNCGDKNTEPAGQLGDKVSENVDYCPWTTQAALWVDPGDGWVEESQNIIIDVRITANAMYGVEFDLDFDETLVEVIGITIGSMWPGSEGTDYTVIQDDYDNLNGTIEFAAYLLDPQPEMDIVAGQVARIEFRGLDAGVSDLDLNDAIASTIEGVSIAPLLLEDGTLTVFGHGCVHGVVEVQGRPGDWDGAQVTASGGPGGGYSYGPITSANDGYWQICDVIEGDYEVEVEMALYLDGLKTGVSITDAGDTNVGQVKVLGGDCNDSDGPPYGIDSLDAGIVGTAFGATSVDSHWNLQADINDSGNVNILDAALLGGNWHKSSPVPW